MKNFVNYGSPWKDEGFSSSIEAIQIKIVKKNLGLTYTPHVQTYGWLDWVKDGELAGTTGESKRLEALEIRLVEK